MYCVKPVDHLTFIVLVTEHYLYTNWFYLYHHVSFGLKHFTG